MNILKFQKLQDVELHVEPESLVTFPIWQEMLSEDKMITSALLHSLKDLAIGYYSN